MMHCGLIQLRHVIWRAEIVSETHKSTYCELRTKANLQCTFVALLWTKIISNLALHQG